MRNIANMPHEQLIPHTGATGACKDAGGSFLFR